MPGAPSCQHQQSCAKVVGAEEFLAVLEPYSLAGFITVKPRNQQISPTPRRHGPLHRAEIAVALRMCQEVEEWQQLYGRQSRRERHNPQEARNQESAPGFAATE